MYGPNTKQVEWLLAYLRELPARHWKKLEDGYRANSVEKSDDALAAALDRSGLREEWFALRHEATEIARAAARAYAKAVHEQRRTLEYAAAVNAWDGQHETSFSEDLPPAHGMAFADASCAATGLVMMRPFVSGDDFASLWIAYEPVIPLLSGERSGAAPQPSAK